MGMLDRWLGGRNDYPPLPADDQARASLDEVKTSLEQLAGKVRDHLEIVPGEHEAFVYLGKPPKHFGIAWLHDGKVDGLNELVDQHKLSQSQVETLISALGNAYVHASDAPRYSTEVGGRRVTVIPSRGLGKEVHQIIEGAIH
ncbi:MAG: hypothetical protein GWP60_07500 [Gammaproteobacteria bacterium]|nr:hypothetical protein [Gammaproteobacteria bacterium]